MVGGSVLWICNAWEGVERSRGASSMQGAWGQRAPSSEPHGWVSEGDGALEARLVRLPATA
jgi:hypothetical protein